MSVRIIAGQAKGRPLRIPRGSRIRPTSELVRGALFSILAPLLQDSRVLDLFAGTGALGIEALSRGAAWADFVESHPRQHAALKADLQALGFADRSGTWRYRVEHALSTLPGPYQIIFLDPPYSYPHLASLLEQIATSPLVEEASVLAVEHSRRQPLPQVCGPAKLAKHRTYGDTAISIYQRGGREW